MQINKREKILLIILGLLILVVGYEKLVFEYQRERVAALSINEQKLKADYDLIQTKINSMKTNEMNIKIMNSNLEEKASQIYPSIEQEKIILELDDMVNKSGIKTNLTFTEKVIGVKANDDKNSKDNTKDTNVKATSGKASKALDDMEQIKVTMNFKGSYDNIMKFLDIVEKNKKIIAVSNLNLNQVGINEITGSAQIELYGTQKVNSANEEYLKWNLNNKYGNKNPFNGASATFNIEQAIDKNKVKDDFVLSIRSVNSDLPSFMLGKSNDTNKITYIYNDSNKVEDVEVYLTNKDNKYYYKYKNSKSSYPLSYTSLGTEFSPAGKDIILKIFSASRIDLNDASAINLKVINDTDKNVKVNIINDDTVTSRVKVTSEKGNVEVNKN